MNKKLAKLKYLPNNFEILEHSITDYIRQGNKSRRTKLLECRSSRTILFLC